MNVMDILMRITRPTGEGQNKQPEHVERCHPRYGQSNGPQNSSVMRTVPRCGEDQVLAEEAREPGNPGDGKRSNHKCPESPGHLFSKTAHFRDVLNAAHSVNHASCSQEEKCFEKRMCHQVEHASGVGTSTARQEHVSQLAD